LRAKGGMRWGIVEDGGRDMGVRGVVRDDCFEKAGGRISQGVKGVFAWGRTCGMWDMGGEEMGWDGMGYKWTTTLISLRREGREGGVTISSYQIYTPPHPCLFTPHPPLSDHLVYFSSK